MADFRCLLVQKLEVKVKLFGFLMIEIGLHMTS